MVIGIDLGGTNIHAGVVDNDGNIIDYVARPYFKGECDVVMGAVVETVLGLKKKYPVPLLKPFSGSRKNIRPSRGLGLYQQARSTENEDCCFIRLTYRD